MKVQEIIDRVFQETGFRMENLTKVERTVYGMATSKGLIDGTGEEADSATILAKYDQYGGYITQDGVKVKSGCFYDRKTRRAAVKPEVVRIVRVNGEFVEVKADETGESLEVKVALRKEQEKAPKGKGKGKTKKVTEDSEEVETPVEEVTAE